MVRAARQDKQFKSLLHECEASNGNAWIEFCKHHVGAKLTAVWDNVEEELGINFLSLRNDDLESYIETPPDWDQVIQLMEQYGLSSSDAMIMNIFLCSKFTGLISSDLDIALSFKMLLETENKILFIPDRLAKKFA